MATTKVVRTYGSKKGFYSQGFHSRPLSSSPISEDSPPCQRKRPLRESSSNFILDDATPPSKRVKMSHISGENSTPNKKGKQKTLTQLHFCIDQTILRACPSCNLTYTKGAPEDERLHRIQCARIQRGMEWGREEEKEGAKSGLIQISSGLKLKDGSKGRIIRFRADLGGKIGSKLTSLLETINLTLSSPPLGAEVLRTSKVYLFLLPSSTREKIAGCVIAQRISTAMEIVSPTEFDSLSQPSSSRDTETPPTPPTASLVTVDTSTGLFCHPTRLPTPLGIPRLFVPSAHRRQGIASHLLTAAAQTFIHGCVLDPKKGHVAFTQPSGDGKAVMNYWGGGGVRIYEE